MIAIPVRYRPIKKNVIVVNGDVAEIELTKGMVALIDVSDIPFVSQFKWCASRCSNSKHYYARTTVNGKQLLMHRLLLGVEKGMDTDHVNRNSLDNRRCNLRIATRSQNLANTECKRNKKYGAIYKGVNFKVKDKRWNAYIRVKGELKYLGSFKDQHQGGEAYAKAARKYFGEFARFPTTEAK